MLFTSLLELFTSADKRLFWLFIISSLALASLTITWHKRRFEPIIQLKALFHMSYWVNRSSAIDVSLLFTNQAIRLFLLLPLFGSYIGATVVVTRTLQQFGDAPAIALPFWLAGMVFTVVFFLLEDLSRFSLHYAMHKLPLLWRLHQLHHSAEQLTPLSLYRVHPIESMLYFLRGFILFAVVSGFFIYLFRGKFSALQIIGVDLFGFLFNFMGANLRHSPIWLSFGRFERLFISPAQHQIHHSASDEHHDKNFGTCLALWDHLAGSWLAAGAPKKLSFGIKHSTMT